MSGLEADSVDAMTMCKPSLGLLDVRIARLREDLKGLRRVVARPDPCYVEACRYIVLMADDLQWMYDLMRASHVTYDCDRAQGQGPREARPTSPAEDDPA